MPEYYQPKAGADGGRLFCGEIQEETVLIVNRRTAPYPTPVELLKTYARADLIHPALYELMAYDEKITRS